MPGSTGPLTQTSAVPTTKVSFNIVNVLTDSITGLDSATYGPPGVGIPVSVLVTTDSSWWIEPDINGREQLCTTKSFSAQMHINYLVGGVTPSGKVSDPFIIAYYTESGLPVWKPFPFL